MTIETYPDIVKLQCCTTLQGLMKILSKKPFTVYNANLKAKLDIIPKVLKMVIPSKGPTCVVHTRR